MKSFDNSPIASKLKIATLNYSGILTSPYQYHENQESQEERMFQKVFSQIVRETTKQNFQDPKEFSWEMGSIDVCWKTRLSPVNSIQPGIKKNGYMMTVPEFQGQWDKYYQIDQPKLLKIFMKKSKDDKKIAEQQMLKSVSKTKVFDVCCYKTLIKIIYNTEKWGQNTLDSRRYLQTKKAHFSKPYLEEGQKIKITIKLIRQLKMDVFCIQEVNEQLMNELKKLSSQYIMCCRQILEEADSIILMKKTRFPILKDSQAAKQINRKFFSQVAQKLYGKSDKEEVGKVEKLLNWNEKTAFQVFQNLLIFSPHISSKKEQHSTQISQMLLDLQKLKDLFPAYKIICAGDFNGNLHNVEEIKIVTFSKKNLNICPDSPNSITANKKRTLMQPQRNKGNKHDKTAKDFILSDCQIEDVKIMMANLQDISHEANPPLLPNKIHPYDHYLVVGTVVLP